MPKPPPFDSSQARQRLLERRSDRSTSSPGAEERSTGPRAATDHLLLDPAEIVMEGPYVRQHVDEGELQALRQAITAGGEVRQAIGVRVEGPPLEPRYVLVYGMRRWLASKAAGLPRIPVRNHGRLSVAESLALQVTENEARVDPHPVDTAVSYQLLVAEAGMAQAEVARIAGRSAAHISYMRAVGEAVLQLASEERVQLCRSAGATVPRFQKIAPLKSLEERVRALRALLDPTPTAGSGRSTGATIFRAGPQPRSGAWSIRVSYRDEDVERDPELGAQLERFLEEQLERLRARIQPPAGGESRRAVTWEIDAP